MKQSKSQYSRPAIAVGLVFALLAPCIQHATAQQEQPVPTQSQPAQQDQQKQQSAPANQPETPNVPSPGPQQSEPAARGLETRADASSSSQTLQDNPNAHPVGTAAAPLTRPTGIAASRPAGAAIAPAKQRRVKPIVIRVGIIVGAAAAVGVVAGLSKGSSSRP